jgi:hypothetical protein
MTVFPQLFHNNHVRVFEESVGGKGMLIEPLAKFPTLAFALVVAVFLLDLEGK